MRHLTETKTVCWNCLPDLKCRMEKLGLIVIEKLEGRGYVIATM